jgi:predicted DNA-binding transcriptional regulator AlpA
VQTRHSTWDYSGVIHYTRVARGEVNAMEANAEDRWLSRQELADRYGVPVKTPAEWASKGTGPRYAKFGRHVRYRLSDVIDWESKRFAEDKRSSA